MIPDRRPAWRSLFLLFSTFVLLGLAACSGGSGDDECTTCPPPPPETGALRLAITYESAALGLEPAGFRASDVERVELTVAGTNDAIDRSLQPGVDRAFFELDPGPYSIAATGFGEGDLVLFKDAVEVTIAAGDTVDATIELEATLGQVALTIDGESSGTIDAVAGEGVPFTVLVRNEQGQPVPGSTIQLTRSNPDYGQVSFDGTTRTDAQGRVTGTINAPFSGEMTLSLQVDGRAIPSPGPTRVVFATGVAAGNSRITAGPTYSGPRLSQRPVANGVGRFTFTVEVRDRDGDPLPGVPVNPISQRNSGVDPNVDIIAPANGFESGTTDQAGVYKFTVRSFTSSFFELNDEGRLRSTDGTFVPDVIEIFADGVKIDQRALTWNSPVHPNRGDFSPNKQFVNADGQDFAVLIVNAEQLPQVGGGPAANAFVEIVDSRGNVLNQALDLTPESGFEGFRTNAQGQWRGRLRSDTAGAVFFAVKVDGRGLILPVRSVIFQ
ncbi:MAG: hypothetical protein R3326_02500 [Gemmatimonadota bacterium]|nr:hypothetical protein [Gemmatimonadota bacterium]